MNFGEDFGQKVDLTASIRNILRNYPEGTAILKELIQNADDAGARSISFCLDRRCHSSEKLAGPQMAPFQGPALLVHNNAVFTENDFKSIQRIGDSMKKSEEELTKIGRFGIGFNSVYHLTDLPSFVSGTYLVMLDPQARFLPDVNPSNPGKIINHTAASVINNYPDQLSPYYAYGMAKGKAYNGTLFRLPLRTPEQATTSSLSSRHFSPDDMMELLQLLQLEASSMLLFLKHIEMIEICEWASDGAQPRILYNASIMQVTKQLRQLRSAATNIPSSPTFSDYAMAIDCKGVDKTYVEYWQVCNQLGGARCSAIARDPKHKLLRLIPWGGVAVLISTTEAPINPQRISSGLAYCFLPLPIHTALPVMVNGFFELSSNRRDIWQSSEDMVGEGRTRAEWNLSLMQDIICPSYIRLLNLIKEQIDFEQFQHLFPNFGLPAPWNTVSECFYSSVASTPLLYSVSLGSGGQWIKCSEAVLLPDQTLTNEESNILITTVRALKLPLVECIPGLRKSLVDSRTCTFLATPSFLRQRLQAASPINSTANGYYPPQEHCKYLLSYCLTGVTKQSILSLHGLPLLPLYDGSVGCIRVLTDAQVEMAGSLLSMGFSFVSVQQTILKHANLNNCIDNISQEKNAGHMYIYTDNVEFLECFQPARGILIRGDMLDKSNIELIASCNGRTNVQLPLPSLLLDILREIVPASFYSGLSVIEASSETVALTPFLQSLWCYIHHNPHFLDVLVDSVPVVPGMDNQVYTLSLRSNLILKSYHEDTLPESILMLLNSIRVPITSIVIPKNALKLIAAPNRSGVLSVLSKIPISDLDKIDNTMRDSLLMYIAEQGHVNSLTATDITSLKKLPIFPTQSGVYTTVMKDHCVMTNINQLSPELFPMHLIHTSNVQLQQLLIKIDVSCWSRGKYFSHHFLPSLPRLIQSSELQALVLHDLKILFLELPTFITEDSSFVSKLKDTACVPRMLASHEVSPVLCKVSDLYDPAVAQLKELLPDIFFPCEEFQRGDILQQLRELGLRGGLAWPGIVSCASSISTMENDGQLYVASDVSMTLRQYRGYMLLNYLSINRKLYEKEGFSLKSLFVSNVDNTPYIEQLLQIPWLPVYASAPEPHLPWRSASDLGAPCDTRPIADMHYCSGVRYISLVPLPAHMQKLFNINVPVSVEIVATQLRDLSNKYLEQKMCNNIDLQQWKESISCIIPTLYQRLNIQTDACIKNILDGCAWIWLGGDFVSPHQVAYDSKLSLAPYLFVVPQDLTVYHHLLQLFHIKPTFNTSDYVAIIERIASDTYSSAYHGDVNDYANITVLKDEEFDLAISLLNLIYNDHGEVPFVPDTNRKLIAPKHLVYDDVPWLTSANYLTVRMGLKFCHGNISHKMAAKFGVQSLRLMLVSSNSDDIYTTTDSNIEAFGQSESLTSRLRNILDLYPDGYPILSELIQNADDAGASIIRIMIDENSYSTESLIDPSVSPLQGPSLVVYNDAVFTDADYMSLASIGKGTKLEKLATTGRFGLGFNSVYHVTDTPTILSNNYLVIFDPHTTYVPNTSTAHPGIRLKLTDRMIATFRDQFAPYRYFGWEGDSHFAATTFRLPLRSTYYAKKSEISKRAPTLQDMHSLILDFSKQLHNYLLFLRSVRQIEEGSTEPILLQRAESTKFNIKTKNDQAMLKYLNKQPPHPSISNTNDFYNSLQSTKDAKLPVMSHHVTVSVQSFEEVAEKYSHEFLVVSGIGGGAAKVTAIDTKHRHLKLIPMGSVAACLDLPVQSGQVFSFLPLPIYSSLPVHVNSYFELTSNRRNIWYGNDTTGDSRTKSDWNVSLLRDVIAPTYAELLRYMCSDTRLSSYEANNSHLLSLLPTGISIEPWPVLMDALYTIILDLPLLWSKINGGRRIPVKDAVILDNKSFGDTADLEDVNTLEQMLLEENVAVCRIHSELFRRRSTKVINSAFLRQHFRHHVKASSYRKLSPLFFLDYCLLDGNIEDLNNLPLLATRDSDQLGAILINSTGDFSQDQCYYIVNDKEANLLQQARKQLVSQDIEKYDRITKIFLSKEFHNCSNVKKLCTASALTLIKSYCVPRAWNSTTLLANRTQAAISVEWLRLLWNYMIENNCVELFVSELCIVPIVSQSSWNVGHYMLRLNAGCPLLHSSFADHLQRETIDALGALGLYIIDKTALEGLNYSEALAYAVKQQTPQGLLQALSTISSEDVLKQCRREHCQALQNLILDDILAKVEKLSQEEICMLKSLPVWRMHKADDNGFLPLTDDIFMPPGSIPQELLSHKFVAFRSGDDEMAYSKLQLPLMLPSNFYVDYIIPAVEIDSIPVEHIRLTALDVLRNCQRYQEQHSNFAEKMQQVRFVFNADHVACRPCELYDPHVPLLQAILPPQCFPRSDMSSDIVSLQSLRMLGLQRELTAEGVLIAIDCIHKEYQSASNRVATNADYTIRALVERATHLISFIDKRFDDFAPSLQTADDIRSKIWVPVYVTPPASTMMSGVTPPWPDNVHTELLSSPLRCRPTSDAWLCSTSVRALKADVEHEQLRELLTGHLNGRIVTTQLKTIVEMCGNNPQTMRTVCFGILPRLYTSLLHCYENEPAVESEIWLRVIANKPVIFIDGQFVEPSRIAFASLSAINTEPYLYVAKHEFIAVKPLFLALGVREAFDVGDVVSVLTQVYETNKNIPLSSEKVDMCIGIIKIIIRLVRNEAMQSESIQALMERPPSSPQDSDDEKSSCGDDARSVGEISLAVTDEAPTAKIETQIQDQCKKRLSSFAQIYVPDEKNMLAPAKSLYFDDAAWYSNSMKSRNISFVHREIDALSSSLLGVKSLREQLVTGDDVMCPEATTISDIVRNDSVEHVIMDMIAVADVLGTTNVTVFHDTEHHPSESLIHPNLADAQGPAISLHLDGVVLDIVRIAHLLMPSTSVPVLDHCNYPCAGKRLTSCFAITDCLQILSGSNYFIFDPCNMYLTMSSRESAGRGRKCPLQTNGQDTTLKFPDQFAPFFGIPIGDDRIQSGSRYNNGHFHGTVIRLPLRTHPSIISPNVPVFDTNRLYREITRSCEGSLIFSTSLQSIDLIASNNNFCRLALVSQQMKASRIATMNDMKWRKVGGMLSMFRNTQSQIAHEEYQCSIIVRSVGSEACTWYSADDVVQVVSAKNQDRCEETLCERLHQSDWLVTCHQGEEALRKIVVADPYHRLPLMPFVSLATKIDISPSIDESAVQGRIYLGSGCLTASGLPCHIEGCFIPDTRRREILVCGESEYQQWLSASAVSKWNSALLKCCFEVLVPGILHQIANMILHDQVTKFGEAVHTPGESSATVFKYWPFSKSLSRAVSDVAHSSQLYQTLASTPLVITKNKLHRLNDVIISAYPFSPKAAVYLQSFMPFAVTPPDIAKDLQKCKMTTVRFLSPSMLREKLSEESRVHCGRLKGRFEVILQLLAFCLSDESEAVGVFARQKHFSILKQCPLLLMSDLSVKPIADSKSITLQISLGLRIMMPHLHGIVVHDVISSYIPLFNDLLFKSCISISDVTPSIIKDNPQMFLAPEYHFYQALVWLHPPNSPEKRQDSGIIEDDASMVAHGGSTIMTGVPSELYIYALWRDALQTAPLHQISTLELPLLPVNAGSQRILIAANASPYVLFDMPNRQEDSRRDHLQHDIDIRCENERIETERMLLTMKKIERLTSSTPLVANIVPTSNEQTNNESTAQSPQRFIPHNMPAEMRNVLVKLRVPFLDCNIFESPPLATVEAMATTQELGHRLLDCIAYFTEKKIFVYDPQLMEAAPLLQYEKLVQADRSILLVEMLRAHQHTPFTDSQIVQIKSLPLFSTKDGRVVALSDFKEVYWYASDKVLRHLSSSTMPTLDSSTIILTPHKELNQLYLLLGAVELTPQTILKKFTIPLMSSMHPDVRIGILDDMSKQWSNYNCDKEVVELLKNVEFIPCRSRDSEVQYVSANKVFSWYNRELMDALAGDDEYKYFPPNELRNAEWHTMLMDLGMQLDIDADAAVRLAMDVQIASLRSENESSMRAACDRGRRLTLYLLDDTRSLDIFTPALAKRIHSISFVPANKPISVKSGGEVVYRSVLCKFEELLHPHHGMLGFTVMPILQDEFSPPQGILSHLRVTYAPSHDLTMKHIQNLTVGVDHLDNWNGPYSIEKTFQAFYEYLMDKWKVLSPSHKQAIQSRGFISVGNTLIKANRMYFRLAEDMSPLMYEVPRHFGAHEGFLKLLGVKEAPSAAEYEAFLQELASECHGYPLNPNEMRAVLTIINAIANDVDVDRGTIYLPDESSILRESVFCLYNDDNWLRSRLQQGSSAVYILHPSISTETAAQLRVPFVSSALVEKMATNAKSATELPEAARCSEVMRSSAFIQAVIVLAAQQKRNEDGASKLTIVEKFSQLELRILSQLRTSLYYQDPRAMRSAAIRITDDSDTLCFQDGNVLYINASLLSDTITIPVAVSSGLCRMLSLHLCYAAVLSILLTSPHNIDEILTQLRLDSHASTVSTRGVPGMEIDTNDLALLELKPYKKYAVGEIVAYEDGEKYYYGRVVAIEEDNMLGKMMVRTRSGVVSMLLTSIYTFKSAGDIAKRGTAAPQSSAKTQKQTLKKVDGNLAAKPATESGVSHEDLMRGIHSVLERAGIPLSLETSDMMSKLAHTESVNKSLQTELATERAQLQETKKSLQRLQLAHKCRICLAVDVTHVMVPCGHVICGGCLKQLQRNKCPFCRTQIDTKVKLYVHEDES